MNTSLLVYKFYVHRVNRYQSHTIYRRDRIYVYWAKYPQSTMIRSDFRQPLKTIGQ